MRFMKKPLLIIIMFLGSITVIAKDNFRLTDGKGSLRTVNSEISTRKTISYPFQTERVSIGGLAVTGNVIKYSNDYLIRIILIDKDRHEHLIMESYNAINDKQEFSFDSYCEETAFLDAVSPDSIKVCVWNAMVSINRIHYRNVPAKTSDTSAFKKKYDSIRREQLSQIVNSINKYNLANKKLWRAGITTLSNKKYEDKKRILGFPDEASTGGIEYYAGGIFEIEDEECTNNASYPRSSTFVDGFDWRSRHGKYWITPNKHQGNSGYCYFFTCVACAEALTNLYYNKLLNVSLSEQELACCSGISDPYHGVPYSIPSMNIPLNYLVTNGVCDDVAYPFEDDSTATCNSSGVTPNELIKIGGYKRISHTYEDSLKKALIEHGPLVSGVRYWGYNTDSTKWHVNHAMLIVGYGKLHAGDTVYHWIESDGFKNGRYVVPSDDPRIGRTYWIYKNSYGLDLDSARLGYMYIMHDNYNRSVNYTYYSKPPITSMNHSDNEIVCEDADGDGYYFWGIGTKPSWCPVWIPETKDGDDSNQTKGKLYLESPHVIGDLETLNPDGNPTLQITGNTTYNTRQSKYSHIRINSNATLTIQNILNLFGRVTITIESGGELVIDGGVVTNADISFLTGGKLTIKNGGKLVMRTNTDFEAPIGALVEIEDGEICRSNDF